MKSFLNILTLALMSVSMAGVALAVSPSQKPRLGKISTDQVLRCEQYLNESDKPGIICL